MSVERNKLPRKLSLKSRQVIDQTFRQGERFSGSCFSVIYVPDNVFRYAILVSKGLGTAPQRNRIKRVFREAIRLGGRVTIGTGRVLILPGKDARSIGFESIKEDLCRVLEKIGKKAKKISNRGPTR